MKKQNVGLVISISIVIIVLSVCTVALANESSANNRSNRFHFSVFELIETLGICTLVSLLITFLTGLFRRRLRRKFLKIHKTDGAFARLRLANLWVHRAGPPLLFGRR